MSISNGQPVNQSTDNAAFLSRKIDSNTLGKIDLENTDADSGEAITNIQKEINLSKVKVFADDTLSTGGEISIDNRIGNQIRPVISNGGQVDLSLTPFGNAGGWRDGTIIKVIGTNSTDFPTLKHNDADYGVILNGDTNLKRFVIIDLLWLESSKRWLEVGSNIR